MNSSITRRAFAKLTTSSIGLLFALGNTLLFSSCSVFDSIKNYVAVGLQAFQSVINLLSAAGVIPPGTGTVINLAIAAVKSAFADILAAVTAYENAPEADKATLLGKLSTALAAAEAELQQFWADLSIPDPQLGSLIEGLLGIIISTLAGFATQIPRPTPPVIVSPPAKSTRMILAPPQKRSIAEFKKAFNAAAAAGGHPEAEIH